MRAKEKTMRKARAKNEGEGYYHLVSRCAFKKMAFGDAEKEMFVKMLRKVAAFSGLEVLAYCVMSNHFHVLVHVPKPIELTEAILLERVEILYGSLNAAELKCQWDEYRKHNWTSRLEAEQEMLRRRMGDISPFMQCLKQRFSVWYRAHHEGHEGTLWQGRFGSTFVEGGGSLAAVAAYIELNPIRAQIVEEPKDYRWSSYGGAVAGDRYARLCITRVYRPEANKTDFGAVAPQYRTLLYAKGVDALDHEEVRKVLKEHGKLELPVMLQCKVRHFTKGFAVGTKGFVDGVVEKFAGHFSEGRKTGGYGIGICREWNGIRICSARRLQKNPVTMA